MDGEDHKRIRSLPQGVECGNKDCKTWNTAKQVEMGFCVKCRSRLVGGLYLEN